MDLGKLGVWYFCETMSARECADFARRVEGLGYKTLWVPEAMGREVTTSASWLLANTETLIIATGVANIFGRDPMNLAAAQKGLNEQSGGRFLLGIGVSHQPLVETIRGHDYKKPYSAMVAYLEHMANAPYVAPAPDQESKTVIGALHPKMLKLAGTKTAGAHPYLMPPEHTAFAREILGEGPLLCPEQKVCLETDPEKARKVSRAALGMYLGLPNYRRSLMRFGLDESDFENGGSDRLVDTVVAWGDIETIKQRIEAHWQAGADHVCIQPVHPDPEAAYGTLHWEVLEALAPGSV